MKNVFHGEFLFLIEKQCFCYIGGSADMSNQTIINNLLVSKKQKVIMTLLIRRGFLGRQRKLGPKSTILILFQNKISYHLKVKHPRFLKYKLNYFQVISNFKKRKKPQFSKIIAPTFHSSKSLES